VDVLACANVAGRPHAWAVATTEDPAVGKILTSLVLPIRCRPAAAGQICSTGAEPGRRISWTPPAFDVRGALGQPRPALAHTWVGPCRRSARAPLTGRPGPTIVRCLVTDGPRVGTGGARRFAARASRTAISWPSSAV